MAQKTSLQQVQTECRDTVWSYSFAQWTIMAVQLKMSFSPASTITKDVEKGVEQYQNLII